MSQPRSDHQRERADQKSDAQHGRDVDLARVEVTEPELSVYLPHVFLLLGSGSIIPLVDGTDCEQVHVTAVAAYRRDVSVALLCIGCVAEPRACLPAGADGPHWERGL